MFVVYFSVVYGLYACFSGFCCSERLHIRQRVVDRCWVQLQLLPFFDLAVNRCSHTWFMGALGVTLTPQCYVRRRVGPWRRNFFVFLLFLFITPPGFRHISVYLSGRGRNGPDSWESTRKNCDMLPKTSGQMDCPRTFPLLHNTTLKKIILLIVSLLNFCKVYSEVFFLNTGAFWS